MQALLSAFGNKFFLYAIMTIMVGGGLWARSCENGKKNARWETYKRQVEGQLSDQERELQAAKHELGVMKSKLVTSEGLVEQWKTAKEERDEDFQKLVKKHNLKISSMDRTIAGLKQKLSGGTTVVEIETDTDTCNSISDNCVISYNWEDTLKRFRLKDPNIFKQGDEIFESEQVFKIYGEVYEQEDGSLQTRRLVLREVTQTESGEYEPIPDAKADIIESDFTYTNPPSIEEEWSWTDLFTLRPVVLGSVAAFPDSGNLKLGLGVEFFNWEGFGINTHTGFSFEDVKKIEQRVGLSYNPTFFEQDLNFALGVSAGTPFAYFGSQWSFNIDLLFYLW